MRKLLHPALLIRERDVAHCRRLHMAGECRRAALREIAVRRTIRHLQARSPGRHWNRSMHQPRRLNLRMAERGDLRSIASELIGRSSAHAAWYARVAIGIRDVDVVYDRGPARKTAPAESRIKAAPIPGMEYFKGRERHPTQSAESESNSDSAAPSEESDISGRPVRMRKDRSRIPAPSARAKKPAAIVIRSPAPRIRAHTGPTVVVFPNPSAILVWRPARIHVRLPHGAIARIVGPAAVLIQIFDARNIAADVIVAPRAQQILIALEVPTIPIVLRDRIYNLKFGIGGRAARVHRVAHR